MKIAIMQPTFLPWLGYFSLIDNCDVFVFLDNVQFESRSWQQRNRILVNGGEGWLTIPVSLPEGRDTKIKDVRINSEHFSPQKMKISITHSYGKKPFFQEGLNLLEPIFNNPFDSLCEMNIQLIQNLALGLGIKVKYIRASELQATGKKADLLLAICMELGASTYISPTGSMGYLLDFDGFEENGIVVKYQNFSHPHYNQNLPIFTSHLSSIDAIMNVGCDSTAQLIRMGNKDVS